MRFSLSPVLPVVGEGILPLEMAKAHLRVTHDYEDDLIAGFRDAAIDAVEQYTGKSLQADRAYSWRGRFGDQMTLGVMPRATITAVTYLDGSGATQTPVVEDFIRLGGSNEVMPAVGTCWPVTADGDGVVRIAFTAGYAAGAVPASLLQAAKLMLGTFYNNREAVNVGVAAAEMPLGFMRLCQPYRSLRV